MLYSSFTVVSLRATRYNSNTPLRPPPPRTKYLFAFTHAVTLALAPALANTNVTYLHLRGTSGVRTSSSYPSPGLCKVDLGTAPTSLHASESPFSPVQPNLLFSVNINKGGGSPGPRRMSYWWNAAARRGCDVGCCWGRRRRNNEGSKLALGCGESFPLLGAITIFSGLRRERDHGATREYE
jgi:hypothetical protein